MLRQQHDSWQAEMMQTAEEEEEEGEEEEEPSKFQVMFGAIRHFSKPYMQLLLRSSPPHCSLDVQELMVTIGIKPKHVLQIYKTFHWLGQLKEKDAVQVVREIPRSHLIYLVKTR